MSETAKRKRGRPSHAPTEKSRRDVEMLVAFGNTEEQVAIVLGITCPTLRLHYRDALDNGMMRANNAVKANLFRQATKDDPRAFQAMKFWLNCRAGWSEYAPAPTVTKPLGKKEQARLEAESSLVGTEWGALLPN